MHAQEISLEVPSQGARRATEEGSKNGWKKPERFSARQKADLVLRLLWGEALDLLSRELGIPAARLVTWREAFLAAGQEALKKQPLDSRDREIGRLREKLGEATMAMELLCEKIRWLETNCKSRHNPAAQAASIGWAASRMAELHWSSKRGACHSELPALFTSSQGIFPAALVFTVLSRCNTGPHLPWVGAPECSHGHFTEVS